MFGETTVAPADVGEVWRAVLFVGCAWMVGKLAVDVIGRGGLRSTRFIRKAAIVLLLARVGAMVENYHEPVSLWGAPFTTVALIFCFLSWREYGRQEEDEIRRQHGVAPRLPRG